jgi:sulfotransferase family protein
MIQNSLENLDIDRKRRANCFLVGAAKSGTTAMALDLASHPDVFLPSIKEPKFFSSKYKNLPHKGPGDDVVDAKMVLNLSRYSELYKNVSGEKILVDASVDYLYFPQVAEALNEYSPNSKIIIILRNPIHRTFSAYMHMVRDGREMLPLKEALAQEGIRKQKNWEFFWHYTAASYYCDAVEHYIRVFGRDRVHILLYDDYIKDRPTTLANLFTFLGIDKTFTAPEASRPNVSGTPRSRLLHWLLNRPNPFKTVFNRLIKDELRTELRTRLNNRNLAKASMTSETEQALAAIFREDIKRLSTVVNRDLNRWLSEKNKYEK